MPEIGATLREARMRARIDLSEIEAQTKIRARYLRALENEEWDVLPGPTFARSFIRTYAEALGLDPKPLIEEYRLANEQPGEGDLQPIVATPSRSRPRREGDSGAAGPSRGYTIAIGVVVVVIVALVVGLLVKGSGKGKPSSPTTTNVAGSKYTHKHKAKKARTKRAVANKVTLSLEPTAEVWVCLVGEHGHEFISGVDLKTGEVSGPYKSKRFAMVLGNSDLTMTVDGKKLTVPESTEAIGYEITPAGRKALPASSEPSCT